MDDFVVRAGRQVAPRRRTDDERRRQLGTSSTLSVARDAPGRLRRPPARRLEAAVLVPRSRSMPSLARARPHPRAAAPTPSRSTARGGGRHHAPSSSTRRWRRAPSPPAPLPRAPFVARLRLVGRPRVVVVRGGPRRGRGGSVRGLLGALLPHARGEGRSPPRLGRPRHRRVQGPPLPPPRVRGAHARSRPPRPDRVAPRDRPEDDPRSKPRVPRPEDRPRARVRRRELRVSAHARQPRHERRLRRLLPDGDSRAAREPRVRPEAVRGAVRGPRRG